MKPSRWFFRERSPSKVAAVYAHPCSADFATARVRELAGVEASRIQVVRPRDPDAGRKLEPEGVGIARTALRAHATCAAAGVVVAWATWLALRYADLPMIASTPGSSLFALTMLGAMFGLMAGGALTLRPDHDLVIAEVNDAARAGRWAVVVHPTSRREFERSADALAGTGVPVLRTL